MSKEPISIVKNEGENTELNLNEKIPDRVTARLCDVGKYFSYDDEDLELARPTEFNLASREAEALIHKLTEDIVQSMFLGASMDYAFDHAFISHKDDIRVFFRVLENGDTVHFKLNDGSEHEGVILGLEEMYKSELDDSFADDEDAEEDFYPCDSCPCDGDCNNCQCEDDCDECDNECCKGCEDEENEEEEDEEEDYDPADLPCDIRVHIFENGECSTFLMSHLLRMELAISPSTVEAMAHLIANSYAFRKDDDNNEDC